MTAYEIIEHLALAEKVFELRKADTLTFSYDKEKLDALILEQEIAHSTIPDALAPELVFADDAYSESIRETIAEIEEFEFIPQVTEEDSSSLLKQALEQDSLGFSPPLNPTVDLHEKTFGKIGTGKPIGDSEGNIDEGALNRYKYDLARQIDIAKKRGHGNLDIPQTIGFFKEKDNKD